MCFGRARNGRDGENSRDRKMRGNAGKFVTAVRVEARRSPIHPVLLKCKE
jgi:hypothetical protein